MAGPGRPKKHLHEDHHFQTSDEAAAAGAPPVVADSGQAGASDVALATDFAPATLEAIVENPIPPSPHNQSISSVISPQNTESGEPKNAAESLLIDSDPMSATLTESPVEEKIQCLVEQERVFYSEPQTIEISDLNGWQHIATAPIGGLTVHINNMPHGEGIDAFFKRTRVFNGKHYVETGIWVDHMTGVKVPYEPKYWRPRF